MSSSPPFLFESEIEFWAWFGYFLKVFADSEASILTALQHMAKVDEATARSLFSGTRASVARDHMVRIAESKGKKGLANCLRTQFGQHKAINTVRDRLVHYGPYTIAENEAWYVSTERSEMPPKIISVSVIDLVNMCIDLNEISTRLYFLRAYAWQPKGYRQLAERISRPWRYKFPRPPTTHL